MEIEEELPQDKICMAFPVEPVELSNKAIPELINWLASFHGMEAVYYKMEENDTWYYVIEVLKPDYWNEKQEKQFVEMVGIHVANESIKFQQEAEEDGEFTEEEDF